MNKLTEQLNLNEINIVEYAYKRPQAWVLKRVPKLQQTEDLVKYVCSHDSLALKYVSRKLKTAELCYIAVSNDGSALEFVPKELKTNELCEIAVSQNGLSLNLVPQNFITKELCYKAVSNDGCALKYVPEELITNELCEIAVSQNGLFLSWVPQNFITKELCYKAVSNDGCALKFVPKELITNELCEIAVSQSGLFLSLVPKNFITKELCYKAVLNDGRALEYVPYKMRTSKISEKAVSHFSLLRKNNQYEYPIAFVPERYLTEELLTTAIKYCPLSLRDMPNTPNVRKNAKKIYNLAASLNGLTLRYIPTNYYSKSMITAALQNDPLSIQYVPDRFITQELVNTLFEQNYMTFLYFPQEYITLDMCLQLVKMKKISFNEAISEETTDIDLIPFDKFPEEMQSNPQVIDEIAKQYEIYTDNNNTYQIPNEIKSYFEEKDNLIVPIEPASKNSIAVTHKSDDMIVHNLTENGKTESIYYISDIHIEHQIFEEAAKIFKDEGKTSQIDFRNILLDILNKKINEMVAGKSGILLIGGDIADSLEMFKLFYSSIYHIWNGEIISVLGNHELWDGTTSTDWTNPEYKARPIEEIVNDYKDVTNGLFHINLLENEVLIKYRNVKYQTIPEETILNAKIEDLKEILKESTLIVLGGIGYSGLNKHYNSDSGLYRKAITSLNEDKRRTNQFYRIYEKLYQCAYDKQVIVLTHTPVHNWLKGNCNPNWIYVNGHTHQNTIINEKCGATILSDNQIGFKPIKWSLNSFTVNNLWYDPFESYSDGIHKITPDEYNTFNKGRGIPSNGCNYPGTLYALKREDLYMFVLDYNTNLYLMAGGSRRKLEYSIQYYYDNMLLYIQAISNDMGPYRQRLNYLSEEVKKIGGIGTIHGSIVDISFFSHIYVNPLDGKTTSYYAADTTSRIVYDSIKDLIETREPQLIKSFMLETNKHTLPWIDNLLMSQNDRSNSEHMTGTEMYDPSRIIRSLQYIWDKNVIRIWNDDILTLKEPENKTIKMLE